MDKGVNVLMKKKKTIWSVATAALLVVTLSFGAGASAKVDPGCGCVVNPKPPTCIPGKACPIPA
ncbi:hypothetical protein AAFN87_14880 [Solibacillus sp. CAU 1738]